MDHILAIDDDIKLLKLLEAQLKKLNLKVVSSSSGKSGLEAARIGNPDLILLDILMPGMDGFEVIQELRRYETTKDIPILMFTSRSDQEDVKRAMSMGVVDYIVKPYSFDILKQKVETAIGYGRVLKKRRADTRSRHIVVDRSQQKCTISFKTPVGDKRVVDEIKHVFNRTFLSLTRNDMIIIDLISLNQLEPEEYRFLENIVDTFGRKKVYMVCGRHYGHLIEHGHFDEKCFLFISFGDLQLYFSEAVEE